MIAAWGAFCACDPSAQSEGADGSATDASDAAVADVGDASPADSPSDSDGRADAVEPDPGGGADTDVAVPDGGGGDSDGSTHDVVAPDTDTGPWRYVGPGDAEAGRASYQRFCGFCHGVDGEGYVADSANALASPEFIRTASDELLRTATIRGRPGTPMSGWGDEVGGPLSPTQVDDVVAFLRTWQSAPPIELEPWTAVGSVFRGEATWRARCAECHGERGEGGTDASVSNPWFLSVVGDEFLRYAVEHGRTDTPMEGYVDELTPQAIEDLVTLIRSWEEPATTQPVELDQPPLSEAAVNPGGPTPDFTRREGRFVPVDDVAAAVAEGATMVLVDARPAGDYVASHISGAVSVPFFEAAAVAEELDPDLWVITYCGCPHAESGLAADAFIAAGLERVAVLDEGFFVWEERGHPVTSGPAP